jgi:hypothetical protein
MITHKETIMRRNTVLAKGNAMSIAMGIVLGKTMGRIVACL